MGEASEVLQIHVTKQEHKSTKHSTVLLDLADSLRSQQRLEENGRRSGLGMSQNKLDPFALRTDSHRSHQFLGRAPFRTASSDTVAAIPLDCASTQSKWVCRLFKKGHQRKIIWRQTQSTRHGSDGSSYKRRLVPSTR